MASAGLPGTGIGGLFYILAALSSPLRFLWRRAGTRRGSGTRREIVEVAVIALGVIAGIWFAGWILGVVLVSYPGALSGLSPRAIASSGHAANVLRAAAIVAGIATLAFVLGAVEVARLISRRRRQVTMMAHGDGAL